MTKTRAEPCQVVWFKRDLRLHDHAPLARLFTDYEPGIHWSQMQMQSATTGINLPRIYNPIKQGRDFDADGRFIRRWVPELDAVPKAYIHEQRIDAARGKQKKVRRGTQLSLLASD